MSLNLSIYLSESFGRRMYLQSILAAQLASDRASHFPHQGVIDDELEEERSTAAGMARV